MSAASIIASGGLRQTQMRVLEAMIEGLCNKEIAARFGFSPSAAKQHVAKIYAALGISSRAQLFRKFGHFEVSVRWVPDKQFEEVV